MSFVEHLSDLRNRIFLALGGWIVCSIGSWFLTPYIISALRRLIGTDTQLVFLSPTEAFMVYFKTALIGGLFLALPWILYQVAAFILPGLEAHERRWVRRLVPAAFALFTGGGAFAYFVLLPATLGFFLNFQRYFASENVATMISVSEYVGFVMLLVIVCGLVFQIPIVIMMLALAGLVDAPILRKNRRYAILGVFLLAGIATPTPDAITQTLVAVPMLLLYEVSIFLVIAIKR
jgi:sec-independent protein translocase protein TatC